jgi:hypothetical protein
LVDSCRFKAGLDKSSGQVARAAANIHDPADWNRGTAEQSQDFGRRAPRQPSEGRSVDICEILRIERVHGIYLPLRQSNPDSPPSNVCYKLLKPQLQESSHSHESQPVCTKYVHGLS